MNDTIKMFIGDEEVVSDKEFTINEEILSASSTILNNCYPKSWELTKDYVSNFYYPKDYSKFILARGNYQYSTDQYYPLETNIENPVTYETNTDATWDNVYVYGETAQETAAGYNLFNLDGFLAVAQTVDCTVTQTTNGFSMSFTPGADARVGATYSQGATLPASVRSGAVKVRPNTTYTIYMSYRIADADIKAYISFFDKDYVATQNYVKLTSAPIETSYTFTTDANTLYLYLRFGVQTSSYDSWFYQGIQVVEGSQVIPGATYGKKPSLEFPSPLYSVGIKNHLKLTDGTYSHNGIRATVSNGYIILNGEAIGDTSFINIPCVVMNLDGMYTLSVNNVKTVGDDSFEGNFADIRVRIDDNNQLRAIFGIKNSYASANLQMTSPTVRIRTAVGLSYDNFVIKPVLTNDNLRHNFFLNYGIELINTNKNIFDGEFTQGSIYTDGTINKQNASFSITNTNLIAVKPEHNYIFSNNEGFKIDRIAYYDQQGLFILRTESLNIATFTAVPGCYFIRFNVQQNGITPDMLTDVMIRDAQSEAGYEEYKSNYLTYSLDEPLRKIGTTADSLYYENNSRVIERKIGYKVYNGTESWNYDSTNQRYWIALDNVVTPANVNTLGEAMSNIQLITANQTIYGTGYTGIALHPLGRVYITKDVYDSLTTTNVELQYIYENYFWSTTSYSIPHSYDGFNLAYVMNTRVETTIKVVYKWKNYDILFSGLVKNSGDISLNPRYPHYCSLQILDYKTFLSESDTLDFVISQKTIEQAIEMVVEAVSGYGFIVGEINIANANEIIGAYSTLNKTAYDVLQYLAEISGSRWRTRYVDSSTMAIDFYDPDLLPQANDIDYNKQYWKDNNIVDLTFSYGTRDYRNKQIILSNEVYGSIEYNEVLLSNGYSTNYITQNNIGNITSILVNGVEKDFITQEEKDLGADADFYYTPGKNIVESSSSYTAGSQIEIKYIPLVKGRQIVYNDEEITRISVQTDTIGVISRYESRNDILSNKELEQIGKTYIKYKGKPEVILTLTTKDKDLFNIGEVTYFNSPIEDLAQQYMIKTKKTEFIVNGSQINIFYVYEMTSSFNSEKAINYFDNQRNKAQGNIQEGESITKNIDINNSALIVWNNATITEVTVSVDGDNVLNSILNSPFIS